MSVTWLFDFELSSVHESGDVYMHVFSLDLLSRIIGKRRIGDNTSSRFSEANFSTQKCGLPSPRQSSRCRGALTRASVAHLSPQFSFQVSQERVDLAERGILGCPRLRLLSKVEVPLRICVKTRSLCLVTMVSLPRLVITSSSWRWKFWLPQVECFARGCHCHFNTSSAPFAVAGSVVLALWTSRRSTTIVDQMLSISIFYGLEVEGSWLRMKHSNARPTT